MDLKQALLVARLFLSQQSSHFPPGTPRAAEMRSVLDKLAEAETDLNCGVLVYRADVGA